MNKAFYLASALLLALQTANAQTPTQKTSDVESEDALPSVGLRYYYYPNLDAYFDTRTNLYIYEIEGVWTKSKELKSGLRGYSLLNGTRVPITDYNGETLYSQLAEHRKQFPKKYSSKRLPPNLRKDAVTADK